MWGEGGARASEPGAPQGQRRLWPQLPEAQLLPGQHGSPLPPQAEQVSPSCAATQAKPWAHVEPWVPGQQRWPEPPHG